MCGVDDTSLAEEEKYLDYTSFPSPAFHSFHFSTVIDGIAN